MTRANVAQIKRLKIMVGRPAPTIMAEQIPVGESCQSLFDRMSALVVAQLQGWISQHIGHTKASQAARSRAI